jgi:hypothetical protein
MAVRVGVALTKEARDDWEAFDDVDGGCSCHIAPPCSFCTDPGNPNNLVEDEESWEPTLIESEDFDALISMAEKLHHDTLRLVTKKSDLDFQNLNEMGILLNKLRQGP